jgi:hypothetical protein
MNCTGTFAQLFAQNVFDSTTLNNVVKTYKLFTGGRLFAA